MRQDKAYIQAFLERSRTDLVAVFVLLPVLVSLRKIVGADEPLARGP